MPASLLGGHVGGRPDDLAGLGLPRLDFETLGQPEVGDLEPAGPVEQHVERLEVAMDDPDQVRSVYGACQRAGHLCGHAVWLGRTGQLCGEGHPWRNSSATNGSPFISPMS